MTILLQLYKYIRRPGITSGLRQNPLVVLVFMYVHRKLEV